MFFLVGIGSPTSHELIIQGIDARYLRVHPNSSFRKEAGLLKTTYDLLAIANLLVLAQNAQTQKVILLTHTNALVDDHLIIFDLRGYRMPTNSRRLGPIRHHDSRTTVIDMVGVGQKRIDDTLRRTEVFETRSIDSFRHENSPQGKDLRPIPYRGLNAGCQTNPPTADSPHSTRISGCPHTTAS